MKSLILAALLCLACGIAECAEGLLFGVPQPGNTIVNQNGSWLVDNFGNYLVSGQTAPSIDGISMPTILGCCVVTATVTLSTTKTNDIVILHALVGGWNITSVTNDTGLTWQKRAQIGVANDLEEWYAISPAVLTNSVITVNFAGFSGYTVLTAFGISGAAVRTPFNASAVAAASAPVSLTTKVGSSAFIFFICRSTDSTLSVSAPWTGIVSGVASTLSASGYQAQNAVTPQQYTSATNDDASANGCIIDSVHS